jgi:hypothetical protein
MHTDWTHPDLRAAAVEFLLQQCGPRKHGDAWKTKFHEIAASLGFRDAAGLAQLGEWFEDPQYRPDLDTECMGSRPETTSVADDAAVLEHCAATIPAPNIPEGALPSRAPDFLTELLREESDALSAKEREEIARALDSGKGLTAQQRSALATILRGAETSSKAEIVRAVIDFLIPSGSEEGFAWVVKQSRLTIQTGQTLDAVFCSVRIAGFPVMGQTHLVVKEASGRLVTSLLYARAKCICSREGTRATQQVQYTQLIPSKTFAKEQIAQNLALLADMVRPGNAQRDGKSWGSLFGTSKQLVSYHRKKLAAKIADASGARSQPRAPGLRSNPHRTKGTSKP